MGTLQLALWSGGGNVNPFLHLASDLVRRDHDISVLGPADLSADFEALGCTFTPCSSWMPGADELLHVIEDAAPDGLVVDFMANEALAGAEASSLPTIALVHTLLDANRVGDDIAPMWMLGPASQTNETRTRLGLASAESHTALLAFADTLLVAAPEILEPPGPRDPRTVYAGPLYLPSRDDDLTALPDGDAPLVIGCTGTAGTDPDREPDLLQRVVDAIARLGHRGVVTVPAYLNASAVQPRPGVVVTDHINHPAVLPHAAAFVTHAGLGSVCAALVAKTPMVCVPLGREQPTNAAAIERIGAGATLEADCTVDEIAEAIERVRAMPVPDVRVDPQTMVTTVEAVLTQKG